MASIVRMRGSRVALTEAHRLAAVFLREKKTKAGKAKKLDVSAAAAAKYNEDVPDPEEVAMVMADTVAHFRHDLGFMRLEAHPKMLESTWSGDMRVQRREGNDDATSRCLYLARSFYSGLRRSPASDFDGIDIRQGQKDVGGHMLRFQ